MADKGGSSHKGGAPASKTNQGGEMVSAQWAGPLPPPASLEQFERTVPGSAERIIRMAEREQEHRIHIERVAVDTDSKVEKRGQWLGAAIYLGAIGGALLAVWLGAPWPVPTAMVGVTVAGVIKAIITGRSNRHN